MCRTMCHTTIYHNSNSQITLLIHLSSVHTPATRGIFTMVSGPFINGMALRLMNVACVRDLFVVILHAHGASVIIFVYADLYTSHGKIDCYATNMNFIGLFMNEGISTWNISRFNRHWFREWPGAIRDKPLPGLMITAKTHNNIQHHWATMS